MPSIYYNWKAEDMPTFNPIQEHKIIQTVIVPYSFQTGVTSIWWWTWCTDSSQLSHCNQSDKQPSILLLKPYYKTHCSLPCPEYTHLPHTFPISRAVHQTNHHHPPWQLLNCNEEVGVWKKKGLTCTGIHLLVGTDQPAHLLPHATRNQSHGSPVALSEGSLQQSNYILFMKFQ